MSVMVTRQAVSGRPRSPPGSRRAARKDFRGRQVIVQDRGIAGRLFSRASATGRRKAAVGFPLQHTQPRR